MRYLKLFNEHSGYTEAMQTLEAPNVSHCVGENHVHYKPELPSVLPGNEEAWEEYCAFICDDAELEQDLRNIFSKYVVTCYSVYMVGCDHSREHTNDCGETYVSLGSWAPHIDSPIIGPN